MKYKVLLAGNSKKLISNFFLQMDFAFECMTSSMIFDDLKNHIQYFKPDIFIYCMRAETRDDLVTIASFHDVLGKNDVPYAAIGDSVSLDFAVKIPNCVPELSIKLPMSTSDMEDTITRFIKKHKAFLSSAADSPLSKALDLNTASAFDTLSKIDAALEAIERIRTKRILPGDSRKPLTATASSSSTTPPSSTRRSRAISIPGTRLPPPSAERSRCVS